MSNNVTNISQFMGVNSDNSQVLGKLLYFSLSNILVEKEKLRDICMAMGIDDLQNIRTSDVNAFRSATGDIRGRVVDGMEIYKIFCRDNEKQGNIISRELVKETLDSVSNRYAKLANLSLDTATGVFGYDNISFDSVINPYTYCQEAEDLFEKYKSCAGRKQVETIANNFLEAMQALKISIHGRLYFVPRTHMEKVSIFEDFIEALNDCNQNSAMLTVNSMYVMDDEKQREKMATEFYVAMGKEIEEYQERVQHLITTDSQSVAVMNRWVLKIQGLEAKTKQYEDILSRQLNELNGEFAVLQTFSQEINVRIRGLERKKSA